MFFRSRHLVMVMVDDLGRQVAGSNLGQLTADLWNRVKHKERMVHGQIIIVNT